MSASSDPLLNSKQVDTLHNRLCRYQQLQAQSNNLHPTQPALHAPFPSVPPSALNSTLDPISLVSELVSSTELSLRLHTALCQLSAQQAKQSRQLERVMADNQRLRRENDVCMDQLFLHSVPLEGIGGSEKLPTETRRREKGHRQRTTTDRATFLSGFESTDEDDDVENEGEEESAADSTSQMSVRVSECASRADIDVCEPEVHSPSRVAMSASAKVVPFDALVQSLASHPSIQQTDNHLNHLSTLLALQASQPLSIPPTSPSSTLPSSTIDFDRTSASESSVVLERSTEVEAVMRVRVQVQREHTRRARRIIGGLRQLLVHQSAEMAAMRQELDMLRAAAHDSYISSTARDTLQLHQWMEAAAEGPTSSFGNNRRAPRIIDSPARKTREIADVSSVSDVQQVCDLLDSVMRRVQDSGVRSQSYVEEVKRLCAPHPSRENYADEMTW